jgi:putative phosphoesterase
MRLLVISDIHGNLPALEAVLREPHDALVCLGDIVGYGPEPGACVRRVRAEASVILQGNHDRALALGVPPGCRPAFERLAEDAAGLGRAQLGAAEKGHLAALPFTATLVADGLRCLLVHATPADPLYQYAACEAETWSGLVEGVPFELVLVGHTHVQFRLPLRNHTVLNPGSVGQPKDGDPRAAYAVVENGDVELRRCSYDLEVTVERLQAVGVEPGSAAILSALLKTGRVPAMGGRLDHPS